MIKRILKKFKPSPFSGLRNPRGYFWCNLMPWSFAKWVRDVVGVGRFGRYTRKVLFPPAMRPGYDFFNFYLDDKKAEWLRYRCVELPHTQRALTIAWLEAYPDTNVTYESQFDGKDLQNYCADYLGINIEEEQEKSIKFHEKIKEMANIMNIVFKEMKVGLNRKC